VTGLRVLLYIPDLASPPLATSPVLGRSLTARTLVAALRAGADIVALPETLRDPSVDRTLRRMPALARAVRWLAADTPPPPAAGADERWLLLPAPALVEPAVLRALARAGAPAGAVLRASLPSGLPALLAPRALVARLWNELAAGKPLGAQLVRHVESARPEPRDAPGVFVPVRAAAELDAADAALLRQLPTTDDSGVDRYIHRWCSLPLTRWLVRAPLTPNQVSLLSLAAGGAAIWCFWGATAWSAVLGVLLYALATVLDHSDGELARLTFQESRPGEQLDWAIDTLIHSGLVLGMAITAGGPAMAAVGLLGGVGVALSALLARFLPREIAVGASVGGVLKRLGNRDFFYLILLAFAGLRAVAPAGLVPLVTVVAAGSQVYWIGCLVRIRRSRASR
jgi:phosphatidylglycerophosphate synthase